MSFCKALAWGNRSLRGTWAQLTGWRWSRCHPPVTPSPLGHSWVFPLSTSPICGWLFSLYIWVHLLSAVEAGFQYPALQTLSVRENESASLWFGYSPQHRGCLLLAQTSNSYPQHIVKTGNYNIQWICDLSTPQRTWSSKFKSLL